MTEHAVLIAAGGPTGLMLAGELALAGVDVAIGERRPNQDLAGVCGRSAFTHHRGPRRASARIRMRYRTRSPTTPALLTILTRRRLCRHAPATFLTDLAAQDHRARWRSPQAARAATQSPGRDGRASRFSTKLSMQRTYYASVGALLPQSGVQRRPYARGR